MYVGDRRRKAVGQKDIGEYFFMANSKFFRAVGNILAL
jgi:hypothetical protein